MNRVHFRQELSWHFRERSAKEAPCIPTIYPEDASLRRESRRNASTWISTATKRLSSRERVYIRWARPVVIPCSRHRWLTLHTHVSSAVMTRGGWELRRTRSSNPISGHFSMQIFHWTTCPD